MNIQKQFDRYELRFTVCLLPSRLVLLRKIHLYSMYVLYYTYAIVDILLQEYFYSLSNVHTSCCFIRCTYSPTGLTRLSYTHITYKWLLDFIHSYKHASPVSGELTTLLCTMRLESRERTIRIFQTLSEGFIATLLFPFFTRWKLVRFQITIANVICEKHIFSACLLLHESSSTMYMCMYVCV